MLVIQYAIIFGIDLVHPSGLRARTTERVAAVLEGGDLGLEQLAYN